MRPEAAAPGAARSATRRLRASVASHAPAFSTSLKLPSRSSRGDEDVLHQVVSVCPRNAPRGSKCASTRASRAALQQANQRWRGFGQVDRRAHPVVQKAVGME